MALGKSFSLWVSVSPFYKNRRPGHEFPFSSQSSGTLYRVLEISSPLAKITQGPEGTRRQRVRGGSFSIAVGCAPNLAAGQNHLRDFKNAESLA